MHRQFPPRKLGVYPLARLSSFSRTAQSDGRRRIRPFAADDAVVNCGAASVETNERVAAFATVSTHSASAWLVGESISRFDQKLLLLQMLQGSDGMTVAKVPGGGRKVMILQRNLCMRMEQSAVSARAGG